jgi:hypothetical protein
MSAAAFEDWKRRAKSADILAVAVNTLGLQLKRHAGELIGACPLGCSKRDGFSINTKKQVFNCRGAGIGGDVIDMMMHVGGLNYFAACETILAEPPPGRGTQLTPDQIAAAEKQKAEGKALAARRAADENLYRENARRQAFDVYKHAHALAGSSAEQYLKRRGLRFPATPEGRAERIKCVEAMPYFHGAGDKAEVIHRGPAMVLPIVDQARKPRGLHLTYLDLAQPKGKLQLVHEGELLDAKKTRGSKHGNKVELIGPAEPTTLYLGEGAEKVIAVWQALAWRAGLFDDEETRAILSVDRIAGAMCDHRCEALDRTAFWSACDLGNLAGKAADSVRHPTAKSPSGRAQRVAGGVPDLDAPAIVIPQSVTELVLLGDSTSDEFTTRLAMQRAAARYAAPGRRVRVAWAPHGKDFDDLWREGAIDAAVTICGILDSAQESIPQRISSTGSNNPSDSSPARSSDSEPGAPQQTSAGNACPALGWFYWDGRRWSREGADGRANHRRARDVRAIQAEAAVIEGDTDQDIVVGGTDKEPIMLFRSAAPGAAIGKRLAAQSDLETRAPYLAVEPHELDADPFKINLANGTLVVRRVFTDLDGDWQSWPRVSESSGSSRTIRPT